MFRVKVLLKSERGNPKEITTLCSTEEERDSRLSMYMERYPEGEMFSEQVEEIIPKQAEGALPKKSKK